MKIHRTAVLLAAFVFAATSLYAQQTGPVLADSEAPSRAEHANHRLIYTTPVLKEAVHISETAKVKLKLASSRQAANLPVWLVSLPWNEGRRAQITDNIITRRWADSQSYKSLTESAALVPGKFCELESKLQPDDRVIAPGRQIALMIFSSGKDFTLHPDPGSELTIDLDGTTLKILVFSGSPA